MFYYLLTKKTSNLIPSIPIIYTTNNLNLFKNFKNFKYINILI